MTDTPPSPPGDDSDPDRSAQRDRVDAHIEQQKPKVLFAVGLAGVMLLLSVTLASVTAYYLISGEEGAAVHNTLPADCAWVLETHEGLGADILAPLAWRVVGSLSALGVDVAAPATRVDLVHRLLGTAGFEPAAGIGVCGRGSATAATIGFSNPDAGAEAVQGLLRDIGGSAGKVVWSEEVGGFRDGHIRSGASVPAAVLQSSARSVLVTHHSAAAKELAAIVRATKTAPLRAYIPFREGIERVGGHVRLWISGGHLRTLTAAAGPSWRPFLREHASWLAASARPENNETVFHLHIGAEQRGVGWLKSRLDPIGTFDAAGRLDKDAEQAVVLRVNPTAWISGTEELATWPLIAIVERALKKATGKTLADIAPTWRGHLLYQSSADGWRLDIATGTVASPTVEQYADPPSLLDNAIQPGHQHAATFAQGCGWLLASGARAQLLWFHTGLVATANVPVAAVAPKARN